MPAEKLKQYLDQNRVKYMTLRHSPAYTAQEIAGTLHVHGWELAKTTILRADGRLIMAVLPAPRDVDLEKLAAIVGVPAVELASEAEFQEQFPGCDLGAMPPFGNLYGVPVYVDEDLREDRSIVFNAGSHTEAIRMDYRDFERLVQPVVARFGVAKPAHVV